jgi:serine/threonine protein kinase
VTAGAPGDGSADARVIGEYRLLRPLGQGGMGIVYVARQLDVARDVALKQLLPGAISADPDSAERFLREARVAADLVHPNIVTVHDFFTHEGTPYIVMELAERGSLRPFVGRLSLAQTASVLEDLLAALGYAAAAGVVHRDLKPENVLVSSDGRTFKVTDFGMSKAASGWAAQGLTAQGIAVGTPAYIAPEQAKDEEIGPWTDLYTTGVIAYELVSGRPPFTGPPISLLWKHVYEAPPPLGLAAPRIDPGLAAWVDRLLAKDPPARPASAEEAWHGLEDVVIRLLGPRWRRDAELLAEPAT